jgi:ribosomal protein S18 acetylase RimI-like enzyme
MTHLGDQLVIRDAVSDDLPEICELVREMGVAPSRITVEYARETLSRVGFGILVARSRDQVVGFLAFSIRPNLWHAADACLIELLAVRESQRRQGIGDALMKGIVDRASALGCAEITVTADMENATALRLYRRHGLTEEVACLERHL